MIQVVGNKAYLYCNRRYVCKLGDKDKIDYDLVAHILKAHKEKMKK